MAAKRASDDLFAEELGAKSADAENMGDGVRIPAFRQHGHGDDTADGAAELAVLAHGVHDLTQQLLIADVVRRTGIPGALDDLAAETCNLIGGHAPKLVVESVAGFQLLTVDQQCVRTSERIPRGFIEIAEEGQATVFQCGGPVFVLSLKTGDEIIDQLRDGGILADDDEAGRHTNAPFSHSLKVFS